MVVLDNPGASGRPLKGESGIFWRYRVDDYRLLCEIQDEALTILVALKGRVAIVMSHGVLFRGAAEGRIRKKLIKLNILRYVDTFEEEAEIDIEAVQKEIDTLENEVELRGKMANTLKEVAV